MTHQLRQIAAAALAFFLILQMTAFVIGTIDSTTDVSEPISGTDEGFAAESTFVSIESDQLTDVVVEDSTGFAIELTGADDSYVQSKSDFTIAEDDTWTACTWARVDDGAASENMTALSLNGRLLLQFNGSHNNWSAWHYDEGSANSWRVNISAPNQPGNLTNVCAIHNGTNLTIYRNGTKGDTVNTSAGSSIEPVWVNSTNWDGRLEETRTFDDALNNSQIQKLVNNPIDALSGVNQTARIYYDSGAGTTEHIWYANVDATLSNASWVSGFSGSTLSEGVDYELSGRGGIKALDGGALADEPAGWITYNSTGGEYDSAEEQVSGGVLDYIKLAVIAPIIIIGGLMLGRWFDLV